MIGETTALELFKSVRRDVLAESRDSRRIEQCKQGSVGMNQEQHVAMESCTARFVGILAAGSNSILE